MFSEPVEPTSTMSALPPYWVRFELRKKLVVIGCPTEGLMPTVPSWPSSWLQASAKLAGGEGITSPIRGSPPGPLQVSFGAVSGIEPATYTASL